MGASHSECVPIGTVIQSMLTETQIQNNYGPGWILMDGRSVSGSKYHTLTGNATIPDARGRYARFKDNGAGTDPNGETPLGNVRSDQNKQHSHTANVTGVGGGGTVLATASPFGTNLQSGFIGDNPVSGGLDVQPLTIILNFFIKINP